MRRDGSAFSAGFEVAEIATDIFDDDRVRKLARRLSPEELERAMILYLAVVLASWREGRRVTAEDAAPLWLPADRLVDPPEHLRSVGLLDKSGRVPTRTWSKRFDPVRERRDRNRERWARYNAQRSGNTAEVPRGNDGDERAVPQLSYPILSDPLRRARGRGRARGERSQETGEKTTTGGPVSLAEAMAATPFGAELLSRKGSS